MNMPSELGKQILPFYKFLYDNTRFYYFDYYGRKYYPKFEKDILSLKNIHEGERCFVWGSGPSLNKTDLSLLKNETNFASNSLASYEHNEYFDYYGVYDWLAWCDFRKDALKLDAQIFLGGRAGQKYFSHKKWYDKRVHHRIIPIKRKGGFENFKENEYIEIDDLTEGAYHDASVTGFCLQIAFYMGFKKIYLIGCDCDYSEGRWNTTSHNRFFGNQIVNTVSLKKSLKKLKKIFEREGRKIIDCTVGGKLDMFRKEKLEDII